MTGLSPLALREPFGRLPTTDLYFLNPLRALRRSAAGARMPPPRCLAPNVYAIGGTGVIVRYGGEGDIDRLRRAGMRQLVYIIDDDIAAGADDKLLPARYREKLAAFAHGPWRTLCDAADIVIVPGAFLAETYGAKARILPPAWRDDPPPHPSDGSQVIDIVHLGTGSHASDLSAVAPAIADTLDAHPHARLTLFTLAEPPPALSGHKQLRISRPMRWWRYKRALPRMRYHLALYPLADTAFNRARSANKLFEHALTGAASLMSPNPALRDAAGDIPGLFVEGGVEEWAKQLNADLTDPDAMRRRTAKTRERIAATAPLQSAMTAWRAILAETSGLNG